MYHGSTVSHSPAMPVRIQNQTVGMYPSEALVSPQQLPFRRRQTHALSRYQGAVASQKAYKRDEIEHIQRNYLILWRRADACATALRTVCCDCGRGAVRGRGIL
jgi:hypothetical protein